MTPTKILFPVHPPGIETTSKATPTKDTPTELLEESTISSSSSSLHDSLDSLVSPTSPQNEKEEDKTRTQIPSLEPQATATPTNHASNHKILDLTKVPPTSPPTSPKDATPTKEEDKRIVGILKRPSEIMDAMQSSSTISNQSMSGSKGARSSSTIIKKVRFIDEFQRRKSPPKLITPNGFLSHAYPTTGSASPKMRISLASPASPSAQKPKSPRNGFFPTSTYEDERDPAQPPRPLSPQLITLPVDRTILDSNRTPTDEEINTLWKHINAYLNKSGEDTPTKESHAYQHISRGIRCRNSHHPVKLWRRQQQQQQATHAHHEEMITTKQGNM